MLFNHFFKSCLHQCSRYHVSQIWNLCSCECQCESPVRVIKCILGKLWGLVSTYERSPVSYIGQAHLQAVTPSQSFSNTVIFELKSAIFGWAGDHMSHDWERPARVRVQPAALCRMFPSTFQSVFSVSVEDRKRPKNIYIYFFLKVPDLHPLLCTLKAGRYSQYEAQRESKSVVRFQSV